MKRVRLIQNNEIENFQSWTKDRAEEKQLVTIEKTGTQKYQVERERRDIDEKRAIG